MTYKYLSQRILDHAIHSPLVNYAMEGAISEINPQTVLQYPLFLVSPTGTHRETRSTITYSLTFYYFDRLLDDESNASEIYSYGMQVIKNILTRLEYDDEIMSIGDEISYQFYLATDGKVLNDTCAGVWATVEITTENNINCPED